MAFGDKDFAEVRTVRAEADERAVISVSPVDCDGDAGSVEELLEAVLCLQPALAMPLRGVDIFDAETLTHRADGVAVDGEAEVGGA